MPDEAPTAARDAGHAAAREHPGEAGGALLGRYVIAASAARTADEGMAPALALLVAAAGREPAFAGVLLAAAGLPHVIAGPLTGAALDRSARRRTVLALAPLVFGLVLAAVAVGIGRVPDVAVVALVACAGCAGPLLAGGMTAELTKLPRGRTPRALALDGASYNAAAIAGPGVVAGAAALAGAEIAAIALGALALVAAPLAAWLPTTHASCERRSPGLGGARRLWTSPPLRRVTAGTTLAFAGAGALPLLVIARADELGSPATGAALLAAMAAGALAGSLLLAAGRPSRRRTKARLTAGADEPPPAADPGCPPRRRVFGPHEQSPAAHAERRVVVALLALAVALGVAAAAPGLPLFGAALMAAGLADSVLLPAILAVRAEHSRAEERGAVFTTAASIKITAGAAGAAIGGALLTTTGVAVALAAAAALHAAGALVCLRGQRPIVRVS